MATSPGGAGDAQIVVTSVAAGGGRWQVTADQGIGPQWGADGKSLFYRSQLDSTIKVLSFDSNGDIFVPGKTHEIAGTNVGFGASRASGSYAVHPDGKRLAILVPEEQATKTFDTLRVLLNFQAPPAN